MCSTTARARPGSAGASTPSRSTSTPTVTPELTSPRRVAHPPLAVVVFVVGAASLGSEIAAARLLAPYFGASTIVWANTIATALVAPSVGYWLGGPPAHRPPLPPHMSALLLLAARRPPGG